jgi:ribosomal-protein-alanine N-acetyltransferase
MDYNIRNVGENDLDEIQNIEEESFAYPFSKKQFLQLYTDYNKIFFVAEKNKEILGYIVGMRGFRKIIIASIAVKENYRKKGIATKLTNHLIKKVREMVKTIELQVRISNKPAIFFYEKIGFTYKNILPLYYPDREDAVLYYKDL